MKSNFYAYLFVSLMSINLFADDQCMSSKWGDADEIGNANLMNASSVLKA